MLTYKKSGVDIQKANLFTDKIKSLVNRTKKGKALKDLGGFGALFEFDIKKYKRPVFVSSTDGVGTKLKLAFLLNKHDTVGIDMVAMNVNDVLCLGAKPLFFLDYIATGKLDVKVLVDVLKGITDGCLQAGAALIGGETAEMPSFYKKGEYDLAGFCAGVVDKDKIIDGSKIKAGDVVIGIASSGPHSNGYSLIRKVFSTKDLKKYSKELLAPTRIYVKPVLGLIEKYEIKGIAHMTGGAFFEKLPKVLPRDKSIIIELGSWPIPKIFQLIQQKGKISAPEMFKAFNMGIGLSLVVSPKSARPIIANLKRQGYNSWVIGKVASGKKEVKFS